MTTSDTANPVAAVAGPVAADTAKPLPGRPVIAAVIAVLAYYWVPTFALKPGQPAIFALLLLAAGLAAMLKAHSASASAAIARTTRYLALMLGLCLLLGALTAVSHLVHQTPVSEEYVRYIAKLPVYSMLGAVVLLSVRSADDLRVFLAAMAVSATLSVGVIGIYQYFSGTVLLPSDYYDEMYGLLGERFRLVGLAVHDPNYAALDLLPPLLASLVFAAVATPRRRAAWLAATGICMAALVLAFSRTALLLAIAGMAALAAMTRLMSRRTMAALVLAAAGLGLIVFALGADYFLDERNLDRIKSSRTLGWREQVTMAALEGFAEKPLVGCGGQSISKYVESRTSFPFTAHNFYATILFHHGLAGAAAVFGIMGFALRRFWRAYRVSAQSGLAAAIAALLLVMYCVYLLFVCTVSDELGYYVCLYVAMAFAAPAILYPQEATVGR